MATKVFLGFDPADPQDRKKIDEFLAYFDQRKKGINQQANGTNKELVEAVCRAKVGRVFVVPVSRKITPNQWYGMEQLRKLTPNTSPTKLRSLIAVLGRPERRLGGSIFQKKDGDDGKKLFSMSAEMKAALTAD